MKKKKSAKKVVKPAKKIAKKKPTLESKIDTWAKDIPAIEQMRKRRTQAEICKDLTNKRNRLYTKRNNTIKSLQSGLSPKKKEVAENRLARLNNRIDKVKVKMFRCGKKYSKFKKERQETLRKISKLKRELVAMAGGGKKFDVGRNELLTEITELNEYVISLSELMGMDLIEKETAQIGIVDTSLELNETTELVVLWKARQAVNDLLGGDILFETIDINGEIFSTDNKISALEELDVYIAEVAAKQRDRKFKTPVLAITINLLEKSIIIQ